MDNNQTIFIGGSSSSSSSSEVSVSSSSSSSEVSVSGSSSSSSSGVSISLSGELTSTDSSFSTPNGSGSNTFADEFELETTTGFGQPLNLSLVANGSIPFDTFLQVFNGDTGEIIVSDNDGGDGLNSLINDLVLQEGVDYRVRVTSFGSVSTENNNSYTLQASLSQGDLSLNALISDRAPTVNVPIADISVDLGAPDQIVSLSNTFADLDGDEIALEVLSNSNSNLVIPTLNASDLNLDFQNNQFGTSEITIRATANGRSVDETFSVSVNAESSESEGFDVQYYRFQNSAVPGTYIFVDSNERASILADPNLQAFVEEGTAFRVRQTPGDNLVEVNRYQSSQIPGTYLFSTASDFQSDSQINQSDFVLEGLAFYAYGADSGKGDNYYRFENDVRPGTFLFAESTERASILSNFPIFEDQGTAWAVEAS